MSGQSSTPASTTPSVPRRRRTVAPLVIAGAIAAIGFAVLGTSTSGGAGMYYYSLGDLQGKLDQVAGQDIKVAGRIAHDSVRGEPASASFRFELEDDDGNRLTIAYRKLLPDPFEEGRDAIIQGRIDAGVLQATSLTVKCPSRYEDSEQMTPEKREQYYNTDYLKHAAIAGEEAPKPTPAGP